MNCTIKEGIVNGVNCNLVSVIIVYVGHPAETSIHEPYEDTETGAFFFLLTPVRRYSRPGSGTGTCLSS